MMMSDGAAGSWPRNRCGKTRTAIAKVNTSNANTDSATLRVDLILQSPGGEWVGKPPSRSGGNYFSFLRIVQASCQESSIPLYPSCSSTPHENGEDTLSIAFLLSFASIV